MTSVFFFGMFLAGCSVSYILCSDSRAKTEKSYELAKCAALIEERIRCAREPIEDILTGSTTLDSLLNNGDPEVARLTEKICSSDYGSALTFAQLLKNHTEKENEKIAHDERRLRPAKVFLPPAASLLAAILLI